MAANVLWKSDREPTPVTDRVRASLILSTAAGIEGWFYARAASATLGELLYLSIHGLGLEWSPIEVKREWSKIFCFKWSG